MVLCPTVKSLCFWGDDVNSVKVIKALLNAWSQVGTFMTAQKIVDTRFSSSVPKGAEEEMLSYL